MIEEHSKKKQCANNGHKDTVDRTAIAIPTHITTQ